MTCLAGSDGAVVPDFGESDGAEVPHDANLLERDVVHVLAQQVQLFQSVPVNKNENGESFPETISPSNVPEAVEGGIGRQVQHVVVQLQTFDVVKVVEEVLGNALQSVGAQVERVEALLEAPERL